MTPNPLQVSSSRAAEIARLSLVNRPIPVLPIFLELLVADLRELVKHRKRSDSFTFLYILVLQRLPANLLNGLRPARKGASLTQFGNRRSCLVVLLIASAFLK